MEEEAEGETEGVWAGVTFFVVGLAVTGLFLAMSQGADFLTFLFIFGAFSACILYGEYNLSITSGVSLGAGLVMMSFASFNWWFAGLSIGATLVSLGRYARSSANGSALAGEGALETPGQSSI